VLKRTRRRLMTLTVAAGPVLFFLLEAAPRVRY
jgi:hypothetical protein